MYSDRFVPSDIATFSLGLLERWGSFFNTTVFPKRKLIRHLVCVCVSLCVCVLGGCAQLLSHVHLFATPWTIACPPGSSIHGIFQARILEWVTISYFKGSSPSLTQGSNPSLLHLLHWQVDSWPLHHLESPINHLSN